MARRPLHLRWIYVKDHAPLFAALAALFVVAIIAVILLVSDPVRGLLLGAFPTVFGVVVWALTNRAGYPDRTPETLAHERPMATDQPIMDEGPGWDPFDRERQSGDPFAPVASNPPSQLPTSKDPTAPTSDPRPKKAAPAKPAPTKQQTTAPAAQPRRPGQSKAAHSQGPPEAITAAQPPTPAPQTSQHRKAPAQQPPAAVVKEPNDAKPPSERARQDVSKEAPKPVFADSTSPIPLPDNAARVSPAEAAKRDAAARKRSSKKRQGDPDQLPS